MTHIDANEVRRRLRDGALQDLVVLAIDEQLARRIQDTLDPERLARHWARGVATVVASDSFEAELRRLLGELGELGRDLRSSEVTSAGGPHPDAALREHLPPSWAAVATVLLAHPWAARRDLIVRIIDHQAMHDLVRDVLQESLVGFAGRLRSLAPDPSLLPGLGQRLRPPSGLSRLRALSEGVRAVGSTVASAMGSELERQLETKAREFSSQALSTVIGQIADALTSPDQLRTMAAWRVHGLAELLDTPVSALMDDALDQDLEALVDPLLQAWREQAGEDSQVMFTHVFQRSLARLGDATWADQLRRLGVLDEWREAIGELLVDQLTPLLDAPAFSSWLESLLSS